MEEIFRLVILLLAAICGRYLIPLLRDSLDAQKLAFVINWAGIFVRAAEQMITGVKMGEDRKEFVIKRLKEKLDENNIHMSEDDIEALIEEAVNTMKAGN